MRAAVWLGGKAHGFWNLAASGPSWALPLRSLLGVAPILPGSWFLICDQVLVAQLVERMSYVPLIELLLYARHRANSSTGIF